MANFAFTNSGSLPQSTPSAYPFNGPVLNTGPKVAALNIAKTSPSPYGGITNTGLNTNASVGSGSSTVPYAQANTGTIQNSGVFNTPTTGVLPNPSIGNPVKPDPVSGLLSTISTQGGSHTVNNVDGSSTTTKVNPAATSTSSPSSQNLSSYQLPPDANTNANFQTQGLGQNSAPAGTTVPQPNGNNQGANVTSSGSTDGPTYKGLVNSLVAAGSKTQTQQNQTSDQIAQLRNSLQTDIGVIQGQPQELNFQTGRINALQTQEAAKEANLQGQLSNQIAAGTQNINAIGTGITALSPSNSTQQVSPTSTVIGADGKPVYGLGAPNSGGANALSTAVSTYAQKVQSGQMSYKDAVSALGAYGPQGQQALTTALGPGFNVNTSTGNADAQASTASSQGQQIASYKSAQQQGQNLQSQLTDLISTFGLNPNDVNAANSGLQAIAKNTSSPQYQVLNNYINDIANTYAQILTPNGGSQTDTTRSIAASMLDSTAKGESIISVMKSLDNAANAKIAGVSTQNSSSSAPAGFGWDGN